MRRTIGRPRYHVILLVAITKEGLRQNMSVYADSYPDLCAMQTARVTVHGIYDHDLRQWVY